MVHSSETKTNMFLDGGLSETRGSFGPGSGMRLFGDLALVYVLYELGLRPQDLLRRKKLPSRSELRERVRLEAKAAKGGAKAESA
jgi:hypothetical protein